MATTALCRGIRDCPEAGGSFSREPSGQGVGPAPSIPWDHLTFPAVCVRYFY